MRLLMAVGAALAFAAHAAPPNVSQVTHGWCSPAVANVKGNVTINCQGVDPKALEQLNARLDAMDKQIVERVRDAEEWAAKYRDLKTRLTTADPTGAEQRAAAMLKEGQLDEAGKVLDEQLAKEDDVLRRLARLQFSRAEVYALQFHPLKALPHYRKAHQYDPGNIDYTLALANALLAQREYNAALPLFEQIIAATEKKANASDPAALLARARAYQGMASLARLGKLAKYPDVAPIKQTRVHVAHVLVRVPTGGEKEAEQSARARIEDVIRRARAGEDFAKLARDVSDDTGSAAKGGDIGFIGHGETVAPFERVAFSLKKGEIGGPVRTSFGFHAIRVLDVQTVSKHPGPNLGYKERAEQSVAYHERAVAIYRRLDARAPGAYTFELAKAIQQMAQDVFVRDMPKLDSATKLSNEAADLYERLAAGHPEKRAYYLAHAMGTLTNLAAIQKISTVGKHEPPPALKRVLSLHEQISATSPDYFTVEVAGSYFVVSFAYFLQQDFKKSEEAAGIAIAILEKRAKLGDEFYPALPQLYMARSMALSSLHRPKEALIAAENAVRIGRQLAQRSPNQFEPQLSPLLEQLARAQRAVGQKDNAERTEAENRQIRNKYGLR